MATYYVDGAFGDDANTGLTVVVPFKTVTHGISTMNPGDTLYIKGGIVYNETGLITKTASNTSYTIKPYPNDGEKPVIVYSGDSYFLKLSGGPLSSATCLDIYNIQFRLTGSGYAIYLDPSTNYPAYYIYNCEFIGDYVYPYKTVKKAVGIYKIPDNAGTSGIQASVIVENCLFYKLYMGMRLSGSGALSHHIWSNIFYACGSQLIPAMNIFLATSGVASTNIVEHAGNLFYQCPENYSYPTYDNEYLHQVPSDLLEIDPMLVDPSTYNFKLQDGSPCIDGGYSPSSAYDDANRPPAKGSTTPDIGSWGGRFNLSQSDIIHVFVDGVEQVNPNTNDTGFYPYDLVTITGKDTFVRWYGDSLSLLQSGYYEKNNVLRLVTSGGISIYINSLYGEIQMVAGIYDMEIEQGATYKKTLIWRDTNEDIVDTSSGYTAALKIKPRKDSATTILSLTNGSGITLGATTITLEITNTQTAAMDFKYAVYDFEITETSTGKVTRLLEGRVKLNKEVTK